MQARFAVLLNSYNSNITDYWSLDHHNKCDNEKFEIQQNVTQTQNKCFWNNGADVMLPYIFNSKKKKRKREIKTILEAQ